MAPSASTSATVLAVMVVLVLLGIGCPAAGMTACKDCKPQCNSTCSAANFAGAGPCGADCSPTPGCSGCISYYQGKCMSGCLRACKAQTPDGYDCQSTCNGNCSNQSSLCSAVCDHLYPTTLYVMTKLYMSYPSKYVLGNHLYPTTCATNGNLPRPGGGSQDKALLVPALVSAIKDKKLDDMWGVNEWSRLLMTPFSYGAPGSRVLATTRHEAIAR
ncbi:hypothetical protein TRIUR3_26775 [Triticum urartu]|uniref:Uncharacterized protein n=1 Tax=Triticum urartu TaxID=4572 RepID=M8AKF4_TRIUA|nr:hypothetical protein TRIUR3_26775 [Triticum urartu]